MVRRRAWQGRTRLVTFRERSRARCAVGPLLLAACGLSKTAGLPSPSVPGAILIVSDSQSHRIEDGRVGAGERAGPVGPLFCIAFSAFAARTKNGASLIVEGKRFESPKCFAQQPGIVDGVRD